MSGRAGRWTGLLRRRRDPIDVAAGERLLAWGEGEDGVVVGGTREALYLARPDVVPVTRLAWEQVQAADWDAETRTLQVAEVGDYGVERRVHRLVLDDPARLLMLVRERVTASVVLQRHAPVNGRRGVRVVARRPPAASGAANLTWVFEYDEGVDPTDQAVRDAAATALDAARREVGLT